MENNMDDRIKGALLIEGWMSEKELLWLSQNSKDKEVVIELGSWKGRSTRCLGDNCSGIVYAIDHFSGSKQEIKDVHADARKLDGDYVYLEFLKNNWDLILKGKIIPIRANDYNVAKFLLDHNVKANMIFIDSDHSYEKVKKNIKDSIPLLKSGGLLCGHDYTKGWDGVVKAVNEFFPNVKVDPNTSIWHTTV